MRYLVMLCGFGLLLSVCACGGGVGASDSNASSNTEATNAPSTGSNGPKGELPKSGEPAKPDADPESEPVDPEVEKPKPPQHEADYIPFEGGLTVWPSDNRAELNVVLLGSQSRALEFLLVAPGGANHEALFQTGCSAEDLKRALEILGMKEAPIDEKFLGRGHSGKPLGDRVKLGVKFTHAKTGKETTVPIEDWLVDMRTGKAPESAGFVFTGSHEKFDADLNRSVVEADLKGNLIALWRDGSCLLDNDREGGGIPDIYSPNPEADGIPKAFRGQQPTVTLVFEPWKD
ncbi:YdjY domain-containing protein [Planctomycetota bacterium]|nr:YdjY domain-containing protein [Planctomycetota bacterium]